MSLSNKEKRDRMMKIIANLVGSEGGIDILQEALGAHQLAIRNMIDERVLGDPDPVRLEGARRAIILDTETTGKEPDACEITEIAMVEMFFDDKGLVGFGEVFHQLNEPKEPIPAEVTEITGITNEMVKGHKIDSAAVAAFKEGCEFVVAHHASFDRQVCERNLPEAGFDRDPWRCSWKEIDWEARAKRAGSLEMLALSEGYVYGAHRAETDCYALGFVLSLADESGRLALDEMITTGATPSMLIVVKDAPYVKGPAFEERNEKLKDAGYRFAASGTETYGEKAWYREVEGTPEALQAEADFLKKEVYRKDFSIPCYPQTEFNRFSAREPRAETFQSKEPTNIMEHLEMSRPHLPPKVDHTPKETQSNGFGF